MVQIYYDRMARRDQSTFYKISYEEEFYLFNYFRRELLLYNSQGEVILQKRINKKLVNQEIELLPNLNLKIYILHVSTSKSGDNRICRILFK